MGWYLLFLGVVLAPCLVNGDEVCSKLPPTWNVNGSNPILEAKNDGKIAMVLLAKAG